MKKIMFFLLIFTGCISYTLQQLPEPNIYQIPGNTKNEIYQKVQQWLTANFTGVGNTIQYHNLKEGKIVAQGMFNIVQSQEFSAIVEYTFNWTIEVKDGRIRVEWSNIDYSPTQKIARQKVAQQHAVLLVMAGGYPPPYNQYNKEIISNKMNELIQKMSDYILGKTDKNVKNW